MNALFLILILFGGLYVITSIELGVEACEDYRKISDTMSTMAYGDVEYYYNPSDPIDGVNYIFLPSLFIVFVYKLMKGIR